MEFNHRAVNQQASPRIPRPSDYSYVTDQSLRAGYLGTDLWQSRREFIRDNHPPGQLYPHPRPFHHPHLPPHPHAMHEAIQREIEKQRIRQDIILAEIERRYALEAEVRMELRMEMELALRKGGNGFPFGPCPPMEFESPTRSSLLRMRAEGRSVEGRFAMSLEEMRRPNGRHESGSSGTQPFQRGTADLRISEVKPVAEGSKEKQTVIFMAKHDDNISGSKRKAVTPLGATEDSSIGISKKKAKEEWSCALCQVSATSEQVLNEHLQGKKHKLKEAALKAERDRKKYTIGLSKRATKSVQVGGTVDQGKEEGVKLPTESFPNKTTGKLSSKRQDMVPLLEKIQSTSVEKLQKSGDHTKSRFWCEICNIGTPSQKVMNAHKKGKKHVRRLQGSDLKCRATPPHPKKILVVSNQAELVAENGKNGTIHNVDETQDKLRSEDDKPADAVKLEDHELVNETKEENCGAVDITEPDDGLTNNVAELKGDDRIMT
ncbi:uncharacterized protein LOC105162910 isoform X1 [Sesamum indicum]|uniref:Uncharacterized protein LOC105162910 isoform X1 n=1 Tax=Sesamum indicum TaxID=4182 RepID=A0A6I9TF76_SESIN|nr:uncharacterized protein LOC105162910 isoform X1 [Sesamum indicum]